MQAPDPIETILARLMPPALSQDCQSELEEMIDELAGPLPEKVVAISSGRSWSRWMAVAGIAAALAGLLAVFPLNHGSSGPAGRRKAEARPPGLCW